MRGARRRTGYWGALAVLAAGCGADTALEESGALDEVALGMQGEGASDEHGGADAPWVMCPHRTREVGVDPLGPVIAHGYEEAPGFERGLALSEAQKHFLSKASLRVRADDGPNTVLWEGLRLPSAAPSHEEVEAWVAGAILAAGKELPADVKVARLRRTAADDGAGHALPVLRIWEMQLEHAGTPIAAAHCSLFAEVDSAEGALLTCRLPLPLLEDRERFTPYTITKAEAEAIALGAAGATRVVTSFSAASQHQQTHSGEPLGYLRVPAQALAWEVVEEQALANDKPRIYYRARQCLKLDAKCVVTAAGAASPYVRVDKKTITSCSHRPAAPGLPFEGVLFSALGLAFALAARRRSR
jgi:hypothetical protein